MRHRVSGTEATWLNHWEDFIQVAKSPERAFSTWTVRISADRRGRLGHRTAIEGPPFSPSMRLLENRRFNEQPGWRGERMLKGPEILSLERAAFLYSGRVPQS